MESKLNREAISEYSSAFSSRICDDYFQEQKTISGADILNITDVRQVNLFVIFSIMEAWDQQLEKLQSPYFDYSHEQVQSGLQQFMNVLSRHVQTSRTHLEPLLQTAVEQSILLICAPYVFYTEWVARTSSYDAKELAKFSKYIKVNSALYESYLEKMQRATEATKETALRLLDEVFQETTSIPEDIQPYVDAFNKVLSLPVAAIYGQEEDVPEKENVTESKPVEASTDKTDEEIKTLNDQLSKEATSLLDGLKKKRISSIKNHLSINQKFIFINQLFDGNSQDFNSVVDFLDNCQTQGEAMDFINNNYLKKNNWKKDAPEVRDFMEVIALKYA